MLEPVYIPVYMLEPVAFYCHFHTKISNEL